MTYNSDVFIDSAATVEVELEEAGWYAVLRADVDYATDQRLMGALAPVEYDIETREARVRADFAGAQTAMLNAYLLAVIRPDGTRIEVPAGRAGDIDRVLGEDIVKAIGVLREGTAKGKAS